MDVDDSYSGKTKQMVKKADTFTFFHIFIVLMDCLHFDITLNEVEGCAQD